jgi:5'-3' exonuclease
LDPPRQAYRRSRRGCVTIQTVKVHLLDATYELFRAHFGRPPRRSPDGRLVSATIGLVETTLSLLREPGVTHLGAASDHVIRSFRNRLYAGYKTEAGMPPELLAQFDLAEDALRAIGVIVWPMVEYEADDAMATAAARWSVDPAVDQVVICSPDKDLAQCVRDGRVVQLDRRKRVTFDDGGVRERFGVSPESIPDYLALVGDASDGYPGLPGWGRVSASLALARFEHLEGIPARASEWGLPIGGAVRLAAVLRERWDEALLYRELARLRTDVPMHESLEDLRWQGARRSVLTALCEGIGAADLLARPHRWQP